MNKINIAVLFLSSVCLMGCSQLSPFVDARREAGQIEPVGSSRPEKPVVCSGYFSLPEERLELAQKECDKLGKKAVSKDISMFECKLLAPVKEVFVCE